MLSFVVLAALFSSISDAAPTSPSSCKDGFLNTVFNTGVSAQHSSSWPQPIWNTLTSYGISNFITFSLLPIDQNHNFDIAPGVPAKYDPALEAARIPMVVDKNDISNAQTILTSGNTPAFLELFNEPDFSYGGATLLEDPIPSAQDLQKLLTMPHPNTQFISPALANPLNASWLPVFFDRANCQNCLDQIDIVATHIYDPNVDTFIASVTQFHDAWPDKRIWITEMGPYNGGGSGCHFDQAGVVQYAKDLIPRITALGYVDKIFWNCGDSEAASECNPSLTQDDGSATDVLRALGGACGFGGA